MADLDLAIRLGVGQDTVSRIERRSDILLSTLRRYVEAMGGELKLVASFPNREPLVIDHIASNQSANAKNHASAEKAKSGRRSPAQRLRQGSAGRPTSTR